MRLNKELANELNGEHTKRTNRKLVINSVRLNDKYLKYGGRRNEQY